MSLCFAGEKQRMSGWGCLCAGFKPGGNDCESFFCEVLAAKDADGKVGEKETKGGGWRALMHHTSDVSAGMRHGKDGNR